VNDPSDFRMTEALRLWGFPEHKGSTVGSKDEGGRHKEIVLTPESEESAEGAGESGRNEDQKGNAANTSQSC